MYVRSALASRTSSASGPVLSPSRAEPARCTCARHSHRGLRPLPGSSFLASGARSVYVRSALASRTSSASGPVLPPRRELRSREGVSPIPPPSGGASALASRAKKSLTECYFCQGRIYLIRGATLIHGKSVLSAGYHHIPGMSRLPHVAEYSGIPRLTAPSAVHLTMCFLPDSQLRRLSVKASLPLSPLQRFRVCDCLTVADYSSAPAVCQQLFYGVSVTVEFSISASSAASGSSPSQYSRKVPSSFMVSAQL